MKYPIALEPGTSCTAWGVVVPDLPGCFSAGDTAEDAFANAVEAIEAHWQSDAQFAGWVWALVDVDLSRFEGKAEKINITIPRRFLTKVDDHAKQHGMSRSGFLVEAVRRAIEA